MSDRAEARSLYCRVIGRSFDRLPPAVRAIHGSVAGVRAAGSAEVRRGQNRRFGGSVMRSRFRAARGLLQEQLDPTTLAYALEVGDGGLHTRQHGFRFLGIPMPRFLHPRMRAMASQDGERYRFDIEVEMPAIGLIVAYRGHLAPSA